MSWFEITLLAIVQGIAEFLPISSSGHVVILSALLGEVRDITDVNIVLHAGTLGSILVVYFRRILRLLREDRRVVWLMFIGTLPAVVVGLTIKRYFEHWLESPLLVGCMLPITGLLLLWTARQTDEPTRLPYTRLSTFGALVVGLFQAVAILPGISRSGSTISAGLLVGLRRESAATFSFLLAIPAILGATVLELKDVVEGEPLSTPPLVLAWGALLAFVVGIFALRWLIQLVERGKLFWFAWWVIPVGLATIVWQLALLFAS